MQTYRFSLKSLFIVILLVCLSLSTWIATRKLGVATQELERLRSELGYLPDRDRDKICFISVPQLDENQWRWRIRLPPGHKYSLNFATVNVPKTEFLASAARSIYVDGEEEFTLTVACHKSEQGEWQIGSQISTRGTTDGTGFVGREHTAWLEQQREYTIATHGRARPISIDPDAPAELLRIRIINPNGAGINEGLLVWISKRP